MEHTDSLLLCYNEVAFVLDIVIKWLFLGNIFDHQVIGAEEKFDVLQKRSFWNSNSISFNISLDLQLISVIICKTLNSNYIYSDQLSNLSLSFLLEKTGANIAPAKKLTKLGKSSFCTEMKLKQVNKSIELINWRNDFRIRKWKEEMSTQCKFFLKVRQLPQHFYPNPPFPHESLPSDQAFLLVSIIQRKDGLLQWRRKVNRLHHHRRGHGATGQVLPIPYMALKLTGNIRSFSEEHPLPQVQKHNFTYTCTHLSFNLSTSNIQVLELFTLLLLIFGWNIDPVTFSNPILL